MKNRITTLVVGPGLSRNEAIHDQVNTILLNFGKNDIPIIFDGVKYILQLYLIEFVRMEFYSIKTILPRSRHVSP